MRLLALALLLLPISAHAQTLSDVTGNWAGSSNQGFYFRAVLTEAGQTARLKIWNALEGVPAADEEVQFDNAEISLLAYASDGFPRLEVLETPDGSILQVLTQFADEEYEGRTVTQIQFLDNQFTVIGFYHTDLRYSDDQTFECELDLRDGKATVNGATVDLPPMDFEALNASGWTFATAFDRGFCPRVE